MRSFLKRFFVILLCVLLCAASALAYETLEKGDSGSDVLKMQKALAELGYALECDGKFGTDTQNVVKAFQKDYDLKVDGKAGNETLTLLYSLVDEDDLNTDDSAAQDKPAENANTATVYCADGGKLNLRAGAGTGYKVLTRIPTGSTVNIIVRGTKWCYVEWNGEDGYVMTSFLKFGTTATAPTPAPESGSVAAIVTTANGGKLNLRKSASSGAKVLCGIPNGTKLYVTKVDKKWCKTSFNGQAGYVMSSFLDFDVQDSAPETTDTIVATPTPAPGALTARVYCEDGGSLNLRKTASSGAKVLDRIPNNTLLTILDKGSKWCKTSYDGQTGYVMTKYLKFTSTAPEESKPPVTEPEDDTTYTTAEVYCKNGGKLNLRKGPGTGYSVVYQIPTGKTVTVLDKGSKWTKIEYGKYTGYVSNDYLIFAKAPETEEPAPDDKPTTNPPTVNPPATSEGTMYYGEYRYAIVRTENGSLNLRKGPGTGYSTITEIPEGTKIVVRSIEGDWCGVYWGEKQGYVSKKYLVIDEGKGVLASSYDKSVYDRVIESGDTGDDVDGVQDRLVELGYLTSASGKYDSATIAAVKKFQTQHGLTSDGLAGTRTLELLLNEGAMHYSGSTASYPKYVILYNTSDTPTTAEAEAVTRAQNKLRELNYLCPISGKFEELTHDALVDFQLRNGLNADGDLDSATQACLYSGKARDAASPSRYYLEENAGLDQVIPVNIKLLHWADTVKGLIDAGDTLTIYDPDTGLSWQLKDMSQGRHWDVQPATLRDTLIMRKSFGKTSWNIEVVYVQLPDGQWSMATMHNRAHGYNTITNNGFGGQNCVHFLRDMSEAQANDPSYGVNNQEVLREAWYDLTGEKITR